MDPGVGALILFVTAQDVTTRETVLAVVALVGAALIYVYISRHFQHPASHRGASARGRRYQFAPYSGEPAGTTVAEFLDRKNYPIAFRKRLPWLVTAALALLIAVVALTWSWDTAWGALPYIIIFILNELPDL